MPWYVVIGALVLCALLGYGSWIACKLRHERGEQARAERLEKYLRGKL